MCYHRSFIVTESEKILCHPTSDHHTDIRKAFKLREPGLHHSEAHVAVECVPVHDLFDLAGWEVKLDEPTKPDWYDSDLEKKVLDKMVGELKARSSSNGTYASEHELAFGFLKRWKPGTIIRSDKRIVLKSAAMNNCIFVAPEIVILDDGQRYYSPPHGNLFKCDRLNIQGSELKHYIPRMNDVVMSDRYRYRECYVDYNDRYDAMTAMSLQVQQIPKSSQFFQP